MRVLPSKSVYCLVLLSFAACPMFSHADETVAKAGAGAKPAPSAATAAPDMTLGRKAEDALRANDTNAATRYASLWLKGNTDTRSWQYGNVIHGANQVLGLAALREGRIADARRYLLAAGRTPGSPQLDSFGPPMALAQQLLARDEKKTVIQYLDLVARFWAFTSPEELKRVESKKPGSSALILRLNKENGLQIELWKQQIRAGKQPKLNLSNYIY